MKTSLTEIEHAEHYLQGTLPAEEHLLFEARTLTDPALLDRVQAQRNVYTIVRKYGREKLRAELEHIHYQLFHDPEKKTFRQRILGIFH